MSIHPLLTHPDTKLRKRSIEIAPTEITSDRVRRLVADLKETMALENGVGIAAPQIGVCERVIVVETGQGPHAFINPKIVKKSIWKVDSEEGCLSVPGVFGIVRRHRSVAIEAYNENAESITIRAEHFPATVFQHEIDHLDGILFIDKVIRYTSHPKL